LNNNDEIRPNRRLQGAHPPSLDELRRQLESHPQRVERTMGSMRRVLDYAAMQPEAQQVACRCLIDDHQRRMFWPDEEAGSAMDALLWWRTEWTPGAELEGNAPNEVLPVEEDPVTRYRFASSALVKEAAADLNARVEYLDRAIGDIARGLQRNPNERLEHWLGNVLRGLDQAAYGVEWAETSMEDVERIAATLEEQGEWRGPVENPADWEVPRTIEELAEANRDVDDVKFTCSHLRDEAESLFDQATEILAFAERAPEERRRELSLHVDYALHKAFWPITHAGEALPVVKEEEPEEGPEAALEAAPREETA
jgi:hypothetical protein